MGCMPTCHSVPPPPLDNGQFWTTNDVTATDCYLRPSYDSWAPNAEAWLTEVMQKIRIDGICFYEIVPEALTAIPEHELKAAIETCWNSMCMKRNKTEKDDGQQRIKRLDEK